MVIVTESTSFNHLVKRYFSNLIEKGGKFSWRLEVDFTIRVGLLSPGCFQECWVNKLIIFQV